MNTYSDIINLSPEAYSRYLIDQINKIAPNKDMNFTSIEGATYLSDKLVEISSLYSMITSLQALIIPAKREANRIGDREIYQDFIDKEAITTGLLKALDLRYKAINRCLTVRDANLKVLFMLKETTYNG